mmetsp:Transcript_1645/g.5079  ORF Transcript_1645/g.5079 Transcript_1645/m.5079 type:complete len:129 (-) Transcript_1645:315-701(-)
MLRLRVSHAQASGIFQFLLFTFFFMFLETRKKDVCQSTIKNQQQGDAMSPCQIETVQPPRKELAIPWLVLAELGLVRTQCRVSSRLSGPSQQLVWSRQPRIVDVRRESDAASAFAGTFHSAGESVPFS